MPPFAHSIASATRLHLPPEVVEIPEATQKHLCAYAINAQRLGLVAAIAVNSDWLEEAVKALVKAAAPGLELHVLAVPCWGAFVPALNALLEFAQRQGLAYILYQSLELVCSPAVLQKLLDHFNSNVLVVGPVLPGHIFQAGQQTLNGRTTPWNTLALWSVRKLALTGFPRIADGLARRTQDKVAEEPALKRQRTEKILAPKLLGSNGWWSNEISEQEDYDVPAGVEEVTTIALLQHLLGRHRAITVLLQLPEQLMRDMSWSTNWGHDEARKKWHEYKMKSKVSRPNAQLQELFVKKRQREADIGPVNAEEKAENEKSEVCYGTVMHFGCTISPPRQVQSICLAAVGIFYFNSTAVLATAFQCINSSSGTPSVLMMTFVSFIIGGVYILMPISLQLTRMVTHRFDHAAGLLFFGIVLLLSHLCIVISQLFAGEDTRQVVLLAARIAQGLGSGVPFQSRFVLASLSTGDLHTNLQACAFVAGNLGLGLGALLPAVTSAIAGYHELREEAPELWPSIVQLVICSGFLVWVIMAFPRQLHFIPDAVRFASRTAAAPIQASALVDQGRHEAAQFRMKLLISGTTRVFVQSAIIPIVALLMRDAQWTGQFRQSLVVATFYLLQLPFEALAGRICCICAMRTPLTHQFNPVLFNRIFFGGGVIVLVAIAISSHISECDDRLQVLWRRMLELAALVVTLAVASPVHASRLYQMEDAERIIVVLEWMKAYIGRLLGPLVAVMIYSQVGYGPLLMFLCCATVVVAITA